MKHFATIAAILVFTFGGSHVATGAPEPRDFPLVDVVFVVASHGEIRVRLDFETAPNHCARFLSLAATGEYRGTTFHRAIPGYLVQAGRAAADSTRSAPLPARRVPAEVAPAACLRGSIAMAWRGCAPGTAEREWFIALADLPQLDRCGTILGEVVAGMDVVDRISQASTRPNGEPLRPIVVEDVRLVARDEAIPSTSPKADAASPHERESARPGDD